MPYTPHATWVAGDVPVAADLNNWETGIDGAIATIDAVGLAAPVATAIGPVVWLAHTKAAAFTFGTAPVTSAGYVRLTTGAPWGADGVYTPVLDGGSSGSATTTTANQLVINALFIFPAQNACSVSRVEALIPILGYYSGSTGQIDKVEIQVVKITAAGAESAHATVGVNSTVGTITASTFRNQDLHERLVTANLSASPWAVAAGERLGVRIKVYGRGGGSGATYFAAPASAKDANGYGSNLASTPLPIAVTYV
jgi:hypothetical protein